jgi:hypothetical protein
MNSRDVALLGFKLLGLWLCVSGESVFHGNGAISDFHLDDQGHLQEWAPYPED